MLLCVICMSLLVVLLCCFTVGLRFLVFWVIWFVFCWLYNGYLLFGLFGLVDFVLVVVVCFGGGGVCIVG